MAEERQSGPKLGGNNIILLLAAAASAVYMGWRNPPLFSTRPTEPDYEISQTTSTDVDARLWQDPFGAVNRSIEDKRNAKIDPHHGHRVADFLKSLEGREKSPKTLLIGVDLPGDPYPEAIEARRRLRSAEHARYRRLAGEILDELQVGRHQILDALGEWQGGIENSLLVVLNDPADPNTLSYAAACFGLARGI